MLMLQNCPRVLRLQVIFMDRGNFLVMPVIKSHFNCVDRLLK